MANKTYIAVHRILLKAKPAKYAEPGTRFQIDADVGEKLRLAGAVKEVEAEKKTASKKGKAADAESDADGDLV